jgi:hypothetical protein
LFSWLEKVEAAIQQYFRACYPGYQQEWKGGDRQP